MSSFGRAPELPEPRGMVFVRSHVAEDLAALNKVELLRGPASTPS